MKTIETLLLLICLGSLSVTQAQTEPKPNSEPTNNFLDLQASTLGNIFGDSLTGGYGEVNNYLDLVNKSDIPEADKQDLREMYKLYDLSVDPKKLDHKKKDSVKLHFN